MYKLVLSLLVLAVASCGNSSNSPDTNDSGAAPVPLPEGVIEVAQLQYRGAFRLSDDDFGASSANAAIGAMAYNPDNHSIFIAGHSRDRAVAEFAIPEVLDRPTLEELNLVSTPLQEFVSFLGSVSNPDQIDRVTGMFYLDGKLIVNAEKWYDGDADNTDTTLVIHDASNMASSAISGYYKMTRGAEAAGYIARIPEEWQSSFGSAFMTGWSAVYSINSRYSIGPSLFTFDAESLVAGGFGNSGPVTARPFMNFSYSDDTWLTPDALDHGNPGIGASALWNHLSEGVYGFIVPGTNTFAVFGSSGGINSGIGYKPTQDTGYTCPGYCTYIASDNYNYYWLFDIRDILRANQPHLVQPYAYGPFSIPFDNNGGSAIIGGTFDPDTRMLYLALDRAGGVDRYDRTPLIVVYEIPMFELSSNVDGNKIIMH